MSGGWVYAFYSSDGECLYVGRSVQPSVRLGVHERSTPWFEEVTEVRMVWCPNPNQSEKVLIARLAPRENYAHARPGEMPDRVRRVRRDRDRWLHAFGEPTRSDVRSAL